MQRIILLLFTICLLAAGCDRVKDSPEPNPLQGLELKPLQLEFVGGVTSVVDLTPDLVFTTPVTIRIIRPPQNGSLTPDPAGNFLYVPDSGFYGTDQATYEICNSVQCVQGSVSFTVVDTCRPVVPDYSLQVSPGTDVPLNLPATFGCRSGITALLAGNNPWLRLENGRVLASFPSNRVDSTTFSIVSCQGNQCDTGRVRLVVGRDFCLDKFQVRSDTFSLNRNFREVSIPYSFFLKNDSSCFNDLIPESLTATQPSRGTTFLRSHVQGRFVRYIRDSTFTQGEDVFEYTLRTHSGGVGTAKVFIRIK